MWRTVPQVRTGGNRARLWTQPRLAASSPGLWTAKVLCVHPHIMRHALAALVLSWTCMSTVGAAPAADTTPFAYLNPSPTGTAAKLTDAEIRKRMIEESIAEYAGPCLCPYNTARNGSRCGKRSAYSRPGGAAPLCYPKDISDEMVHEYRATHAAN